MTDRKGKKRTLITISSSSEEEAEQSEEQSESEEEDDDDDEVDDDDDDEGSSEWSDDKEDESDDQDDEESSDPDADESHCDRVIRFLQERSDLQELNLHDCKAYLRKYGLRITGTKVECIQRIKEHWRIKDGNGEALYPRSSFNINCTGDVCRGDVVLFTQKVYEKFDKVTRRGRLLGKRTIAGRIVKESYGAAKQQHTFSVEVLWSKGIKKLPPLFPLLVKGRNLYKLKTFRQCWKNEAQRSRVLAEKHKRGAAARLKRAMKKTEGPRSTNGDVKRQKHSHHSCPSGTRQRTEPEKRKHVDGVGKASKTHRQKAPQVGRVKSKQTTQSGPLKSRKVPQVGRVKSKQTTLSGPLKSSRHPQNLTRATRNRDSSFQLHAYPPRNFHQPQLEFHHQRPPVHLPRYEVGSASSTTWFPQHSSYMGSSAMPPSQYQGLNHATYPLRANLHHSYEFQPRNPNHFPESMNIYRPLHSYPYGNESFGHRNYRY
ncbi:zinc finger CCCH domain-containing protein 62-like isoform X2 [Cornus florida]|uniref:zinc finger CCCH domain-containing protein 62-like isoform X2 n=1 Tax=Cornus florida TaxID=4283 RepID=UPI002899DB23|nr:zinc finger CCCH domain-containing protein 62-like isoform X2 [Cornus florida]